MPRDDRHPIDKFITKHGHAPRITLSDHGRPLWVEFHRGYIRLYHPLQGEFYITRNAWLRILRKAPRYIHLMDRQFSVIHAVRKYMREEDAHRQALAAQKRARPLRPRRRART